MAFLIRDGEKTELTDNYTPQEGDAIQVAIGEPNLTIRHGDAEIIISANPENCYEQATVLIEDGSIYAIEGGFQVNAENEFTVNTPTMVTNMGSGASASVVASTEGQQNTLVVLNSGSGVYLDEYGPVEEGQGISKISMFRDAEILEQEQIKSARAQAQMPVNAPDRTTQVAAFNAASPSTPTM